MTRLEAIAALEELAAHFPAPQVKPPQAMTPGERIGTDATLAIRSFFDLPVWMRRDFPRFQTLTRLKFLLAAEAPNDAYVANWLARNRTGILELIQKQGDTLPWGVVDPTLPTGVDR